MTFYEAALRVLEQAAAPLSHLEITQRSVDQGLLSHIGKTPEITMLSRLAAMARRPRDRKVMVTAKDTFGLTDWMLPEDAVALATTGVPEANPEEDLPPLRPVERHPEPRPEFARASGRRDRDERRRDREERRRRYPPIAEMALEILTEEKSSMVPTALLDRAREKEQASDDLSVEKLLMALAEDNQARLDGGRRPQFSYGASAEGAALLGLDASELAPAEVQRLFCEQAAIPFENGRAKVRVAHARPPREAREPREPRTPLPLGPEDLTVFATAKAAVKDARRAMARALRQRLSELEPATFEKTVVKLLHAHGFRELKVARRTKEGPIFTARKREGSLELRYAVRLVKSGASFERRQVQELKRDLSQHGANLGLLIGAGDVRADAKGEAVAGSALVMLWGGDALAEKYLEQHVGVSVVSLELFELDERFFEQAQRDGEEAKARREERHRERGEERGDERPETGTEALRDEAPAASAPSEVLAERPAGAAGDDEGDDDGDDDDEGDDEVSATPGSTPAGGLPGVPGGDGKRRRRRRRRGRRGRGPREGEAAVPGAPVAGVVAAGAEPGGEPSAAPTAPRPAPSAPPPAPTAPGPGGGPEEPQA